MFRDFVNLTVFLTTSTFVVFLSSISSRYWYVDAFTTELLLNKGLTPIALGLVSRRNCNYDSSCSHSRSIANPTIPNSRLHAIDPKVTSATTISDEVRQDADSALASVGWSMPQEGELTSNDPFVQAIDQSIRNDIGVPLEELLNPAKVVNLERELYNYRTELAQKTGINLNNSIGSTDDVSLFLTTSECDGGGGGEDVDLLRKTIAKKEADLLIERRSVFRNWLKNVFLVQAIISFGLSYVMATNPSSLFGMYDWYSMYNMDLSISVLGYWWWWLFVVPSLRSRRPKGFEKQALDISFVATPLVSLVAPIVTKDTGIIWTINFSVVVGSYVYAYYIQSSASDNDVDNDNDNDSSTPGWLKFVYKSLDFGSGRERGARQ